MKRLRLAVLGLAVAALAPACAATPAPVGEGAESPFAVVATVNGEAVTAGELRREMARGSGREAALQRLTEIKVQQTLLRVNGIAKDTSYAGFLSQLDQENRRRAVARSKGEPVYGPASFDEDQYFRYRFDTDIVHLKQRLAGRELPTGDKVLRRYYESVKSKFFSKGSNLTTDSVTSPYAAGDPAQRTRAEATIRTVETRVRAGTPLTVAASSAGLPVRRASSSVGGGGSRGLRSDPVAAVASGLAPGQVGAVVDLGDRFVLVECLAAKPLGTMSFESVRERVKTQYVDQSYRDLVRRLARQAKVTVEPSQ
ncbi:peptidyl-prolyl cis-trans isomerase [Kribbella sp. NPDC020789]